MTGMRMYRNLGAASKFPYSGIDAGRLQERRHLGSLGRLLLVSLFFLMPQSQPSARVPDDVLLDKPDLGLLDAGYIAAIVHMADGSMVIGGDFSLVNGQARKHLARILPSGEVDPAWLPDPDGQVWSLAADAMGNLYVGGAFSKIGGQDHWFLSRIPAGTSGAADPAWPRYIGVEYPTRLIVGEDGNVVYAAGSGFRVLSRISASGVLDSAWNPRIDGHVAELALDEEGGKLYVAGLLELDGDEPRRLLRIDTSGDGTADPGWTLQADGMVNALVVDQASESLYLGGDFTHVGGIDRQYLARIQLSSSDGSVDTSWSPNPIGPVDELLVHGGRMIAAARRSTGHVSAGALMSIEIATGSSDIDRQREIEGDVAVLSTSLDGRTLAVGGSFLRVANAPSFNLAWVSLDDASGRSFEVGRPGTVRAMTKLADGGVIIGGSFLWAEGMPRRHLLKLGPGRILDRQWDPSANSVVYAIESDGSGSIFVGGHFRYVGGHAQFGVAKLSASGRGNADPEWAPGIRPPSSEDGYVDVLRHDGHGNLYASGYFESPEGLPAQYTRLVRLDVASGSVMQRWGWQIGANFSDIATDAVGNVYLSHSYGVGRLLAGSGVLDSEWSIPTDNWVGALAVDAEQRLYVGGGFSIAGGEARSGVARFATRDHLARIDHVWNPGVDGWVMAFAFGADEQIYLGGRFAAAGGVPASNLTRVGIEGTGAVDSTWHPPAIDVAPSAGVGRIVVDSPSSVLIGGKFNAVDGKPRHSFAAFGESIFADGVDPPAVH